MFPKMISMCPEGTFQPKNFFGDFRKPSNFLGFRAENFLSVILETAFYMYREFLSEVFQNSYSNKLFSFCANIYQVLKKEFSPRLSKPHSNCSGKQLWNTTFCHNLCS